VPWIKEMLGKRVRVIVVSGSLEMEALAQGALRVLRGVEAAKEY